VKPRRKAGLACALFIAAAISLSSTAVRAATVTFPASPDAPRLFVEVADDEPERRRGLMFRESLPQGRGMWFVFERAGPLAFWMKNVKFPIDIIFLDDERYIVKIWKAVAPCLTGPCPNYPSIVPARYVLEAPAGFCDDYRITEGQRVMFWK